MTEAAEQAEEEDDRPEELDDDEGVNGLDESCEHAWLWCGCAAGCGCPHLICRFCAAEKGDTEKGDTEKDTADPTG